MIKTTKNLENINKTLVKSLFKYLVMINFIIILLVFGLNFFDADTKSYFYTQKDNLIMNEIKYSDNYNEILKTKVDTLNQNNIKVTHYESVFQSTVKIKSSFSKSYVSAHFADSFIYTENMIVGNVEWEFKSPLSGGVYITDELYSELYNPTQIEIEINNSVFNLPIKGVYTIKKNKPHFFYQDQDFVNNYIVIDKSVVPSFHTNDLTNLIVTDTALKEKDVGLVNQLFEGSTIALVQQQETLIITKLFYDIIRNVIIVLVSISLLISIMVLYRFFIEIRPIMSIYYIFYGSPKTILSVMFLSALRIVVKSFIIPATVYAILMITVFIRYGYIIWLPIVFELGFFFGMALIILLFTVYNYLVIKYKLKA